MMKRFSSRSEAGRLLAEKLDQYASEPNLLVLALASSRESVPVAFEIACALGAMLDIYFVRSLVSPGNPELNLGFVASGGALVLHGDLIESQHIDETLVRQVALREVQELSREERAYYPAQWNVPVAGSTVIVASAGVLESTALRPAIATLRQQLPQRLILATPVASETVLAELTTAVDEVVCLYSPESLESLDEYYAESGPVDEDRVRELLVQAKAHKVDELISQVARN